MEQQTISKMGRVQTALDFLLGNIHLIHSLKWNDIIEQAKQMEKEQIVEAFSEGYTYGGHEVETINGEQYYKEQYGQGSPDTSPNTQNK